MALIKAIVVLQGSAKDTMFRQCYDLPPHNGSFVRKKTQSHLFIQFFIFTRKQKQEAQVSKWLNHQLPTAVNIKAYLHNCGTTRYICSLSNIE